VVVIGDGIVSVAHRIHAQVSRRGGAGSICDQAVKDTRTDGIVR